jgi:metal-dependent amidase/aminoacylase/carboxypeptidase family protein
MVQGGVAENVLAERVVLRGTIRYFKERVRGTLHRELRNATAVADALGGRTTIEVRPGYPPVVNAAEATVVAHAALTEALGGDSIEDLEPMMGAEDFALFAGVAPGCFFWLGAALDPPREHHHPLFDIDEGALVRGAAALASCAVHALRAFA